MLPFILFDRIHGNGFEPIICAYIFVFSVLDWDWLATEAHAQPRSQGGWLMRKNIRISLGCKLVPVRSNRHR